MNYFLVYDEYNNPRVREVISQNGLHLVKTKGKLKIVQRIGREDININDHPDFNEKNNRPIFKIIGDASIVTSVKD